MSPRKLFRASNIVLGLLCVMYFITYMDRTNISSAADPIKTQFHLNNFQMGLAFSAFAYPYLVFQVIGGWISDKWGARRTLIFCGLVWAGATLLTGLTMGLYSLFAARLLLGLGEGATFPAATHAMQQWVPVDKRGFAQGVTHSFSRLGNAVTPPIVAALTVAVGWRGSFFVVGVISLSWIVVWALYFRDDPAKHPKVTADELRALPPPEIKRTAPIPWAMLVRRMWPVTLTYFCYGWILWLFLSWLPLFFKTTYHQDIQKSAVFASGVFFAGVVGDTLGGLASDWLLRRTGKLRLSRLTLIVGGFLGALCSLVPILFARDLTTVAICLSAGFFFAELVVGPIWSVPMDIAPEHSGTAAGLMNVGSALAAIVSPVIGGYLVDATHNTYLPFFITIGMMGLGAACAFGMPLKAPAEGLGSPGQAG